LDDLQLVAQWNENCRPLLLQHFDHEKIQLAYTLNLLVEPNQIKMME